MPLPLLFNATVLAEKSILINSRSFLRYRLLIIRTLLQNVVIIFYDLGVLRQLLNMPVMSQFTQRNKYTFGFHPHSWHRAPRTLDFLNVDSNKGDFVMLVR